MSTQTPAKSTGQIAAERFPSWWLNSQQKEQAAQIIDSVIDSASLTVAGEWKTIRIEITPPAYDIMAGDRCLDVNLEYRDAKSIVDTHNATPRRSQPKKRPYNSELADVMLNEGDFEGLAHEVSRSNRTQPVFSLEQIARDAAKDGCHRSPDDLYPFILRACQAAALQKQ